MIVVDASAMVEALVFANPTVHTRLLASDCHAPHLLDVEVAQVVRRLVLAGRLDPSAGREVLRALADAPILRHAHGPFLGRVWELRENLSSYDAVYVALAEGLGATVLTGDARLARAHGPRAPIELVRVDPA